MRLNLLKNVGKLNEESRRKIMLSSWTFYMKPWLEQELLQHEIAAYTPFACVIFSHCIICFSESINVSICSSVKNNLKWYDRS